MTVDEFERIEAAVRRAPAFLDALRRRGIADLSTVDVDPVSAGVLRHAGGAGRAPARARARLRAAQPGRQRVRATDRGRVRPRRPALAASSCTSRTAIPSRCRRATGSSAPTTWRCATTCARSTSSQPDGPELHASTGTRSAGRAGAARRLQHAGGPRAPRRRLRRRRRARPVLDRASFAEMVVPYGDHPDRYYQTPARHRRVQHRHDDELADARLRLPRRHPLLRRRVLRRRRRPGRRAERDLPPRGGRRDALEAQRLPHRPRRAAARPAARPVEHRHRRQLRLRLLLVPAPGRHDRLEVKATGIVATQAMADGERSPYGRLVAPDLNAINHQHVFCARLDVALDGGPNAVREVQTEAVPEGPENPHGNAWVTVGRTLRDRARGAAARRSAQRAHVGRGEPGAHERGRRARRLQARAGREHAAVRRLRLLRAAAGGLHGPPPVGHALRPRRALPGRASTPTSTRAATACPPGSRPTAPSTEPTSSSGTRSDHHHVPRPEDWPVMPVAGSASISSRRGSSTATRRSTCRRRPPERPYASAARSSASSTTSPAARFSSRWATDVVPGISRIRS